LLACWLLACSLVCRWLWARSLAVVACLLARLSCVVGLAVAAWASQQGGSRGVIAPEDRPVTKGRWVGRLVWLVWFVWWAGRSVGRWWSGRLVGASVVGRDRGGRWWWLRSRDCLRLSLGLHLAVFPCVFLALDVRVPPLVVVPLASRAGPAELRARLVEGALLGRLQAGACVCGCGPREGRAYFGLSGKLTEWATIYYTVGCAFLFASWLLRATAPYSIGGIVCC